MKYKTLLSVGVVLAVLTLSLSLEISAKSMLKPVMDKEEYNDFFQLLSREEQAWIMNLAVWYYDADKPIGIAPFPIEQSAMFGLKPIPSNDTGSAIPNTLIFHFLNGDVPKDWQKEFTKWLSKTFSLSKTNFERYRETGVFCTVDDACDLVDLYNVGGICCPFG